MQLSSYREPCPQPLLQTISLLLINFGQALSAVLQLEVAGPVATYYYHDLAQSLFGCLGHMHWLRPQLQQLLLPGNPRKAAAALQGLQEQQQQLQQALEAALWRFRKLAETMNYGSSEQQQQMLEVQKAAVLLMKQFVSYKSSNLGSAAATAAVGSNGQSDQAVLPRQALADSSSSSSSCHSTSREGVSVPTVDIDAVVSLKPEGPLGLADLDPAKLLFVHPAAAATAAALIGSELPQQLQQFGSALWSAQPQLRCCNNAACANLGSISEAKLVAGMASRCSKCKAAK
jgi:hypothetical protein